MASTPVSLVAKKHKGLRVSQLGDAGHLQDNHLAKLYLPEFIKASVDYPIVFMFDEQNKSFVSIIMWGIEPGENLFVDGERQWHGGFVPASVRCYPFTMTTTEEAPDRLYIGLFEDSPLLNKKEGELIFNDDESETEWMSKTKEFLASVFEQEQITKNQVSELNKMGLFTSQTLSFQLPGDEKENKIDGFYIIDKEKLESLSDEDFLKLHKANMIAPIYAHLASLENIQKLFRQKHKRTESTAGKSKAVKSKSKAGKSTTGKSKT